MDRYDLSNEQWAMRESLIPKNQINVGDCFGKANTLQALGDLSVRLSELDAARSLFIKRFMNGCGQINTYISLARFERGLQNVAQAETHYVKAIDLAEFIDLGSHPVIQTLRQEYAQLKGG